MKMILWVEDQSDHICKVFDELSNDSIDEKLLDDYHIHRVDNLDDALTAVKNHQYDSYLLDIAFPAYDTDSDVHQNEQTILDIVKDGSSKNSFNHMKAGIYLFMYLLPTTHVDQIRIYSGHIDQAQTLKEMVSDSGVQVDWDKVIFNKNNNAEQTAEQVRTWLEDIVKVPERILRHAMMNICNDIINNGKMRLIYSRAFERVSFSTLKKHIKMLKSMIDNANLLLYSNAMVYNQILLMMMTSDCQEQASYITRKDRLNHSQIKKQKIDIDDDFKRLSSVLDRVRNMIAHNTNVQGIYTTKFIAFVFLIYIRYMCKLEDQATKLEKYILKIFDGVPPCNLSNCYNKLNRAVKDRVDVIGNDLKFPQDYQGLFGKSFDNYPYEGKECIRIFLLNFINYQRQYEQEGRSDGIKLRWPPQRKSYIYDHKQGERKFTNSWYDDYFKAFYTIAFPEIDAK